MSARDRQIVVGVITGAQGVRGEVRIKSFTAEPGAIADYGPLARSDGEDALTVIRARPAKGVLIAKIAGIDDRNAAERLKGIELSVPRCMLPDVGVDEIYHADLIGLAAQSSDGHPRGKVVAVQNYGAGDLLELKLPDSAKTVLIPFTREIVPEVDIEANRITIDPPAGLLDET